MNDCLLMERDLLSPAELADLLGIPVGTVYQWNYRHVGPRKISVGRHIRYRRSDVEAWLDRQSDPRTPAA